MNLNRLLEELPPLPRSERPRERILKKRNGITNIRGVARRLGLLNNPQVYRQWVDDYNRERREIRTHNEETIIRFRENVASRRIQRLFHQFENRPPVILFNQPSIPNLFYEAVRNERLPVNKTTPSVSTYHFNNLNSIDSIKSNMKMVHSLQKGKKYLVSLKFSFGFELKDYTNPKYNQGATTKYSYKIFDALHSRYYVNVITINKIEDLQKIILTPDKLLEYITSMRPDSSHKIIGITGMTLNVLNAKQFKDIPETYYEGEIIPIRPTRSIFFVGAKIELPEYITKCKNIISMADSNNNMCFWMDLAYHILKDKRCVAKAKELFSLFYNKEGDSSPVLLRGGMGFKESQKTPHKNKKPDKSYQGFDINNEIEPFEAIDGNVGINIYTMDINGIYTNIRKSIKTDCINLLLHENHFCYIIKQPVEEFTLPDYILDNPYIVSMNCMKNNMSFWGCAGLRIAMEDYKLDNTKIPINNYLRVSKEILDRFYPEGTNFENYQGFDELTETKRFESMIIYRVFEVIEEVKPLYDEDGYEIQNDEYDRWRDADPMFHKDRTDLRLLSVRISDVDIAPYQMNVLRFKKPDGIYHYSYITNYEGLIRTKFCCADCFATFRDKFNLDRHIEYCQNFVQKETFIKYQPQVFEPKRNLIVELNLIFGVNFPIVYKYLIGYDWESLVIPLHLTKIEGQRTEITNIQQPVSVSICSNVDGFTEPHCIINSNVRKLYKELFLYFDSITNKVVSIMEEQYEGLFELIDTLPNGRMKDDYERKLRDYVYQVPIMGFNSGKYDINLNITEFITEMNKRNNPLINNLFALKIGNAYKSISVGNMKFLDVCQYLPPSYSLKTYLKAFCVPTIKSNVFPFSLVVKQKKVDKRYKMDITDDINKLSKSHFKTIIDEDWDLFIANKKLYKWVSIRDMFKHYNSLDDGSIYIPKTCNVELYLESFNETKGVFPYEYMDSFEKVDSDIELLTQKSFYSKLRNEKMSNDDWEGFLFNKKKYGWKTLRDLLIFYNNQDVKPFVDGMLNHKEFFYDIDIDMLKDGISLPSLAEKIMFGFAFEEFNKKFIHQQIEPFDEFNKEYVIGKGVIETTIIDEIYELNVNETKDEEIITIVKKKVPVIERIHGKKRLEKPILIGMEKPILHIETVKIQPFIVKNDGKYVLCKETQKTIIPKLQSYKEQDLKTERFNEEEFIKTDEITELFKTQNCKCKYCWNGLDPVNNLECKDATLTEQLLVRDKRVWTLDRINNNLGHNKGNCVLACLSCNTKRKDQNYNIFNRQQALIRYSKINPLIYLIDEENKVVFEKLKSNITGGPSIVFHRHHNAGDAKKNEDGINIDTEDNQTFIQRPTYNVKTKKWSIGNKGKPIKNITGFDANALYLWCIGQSMPCGRLKWLDWDRGGDQNTINKFVNTFNGFVEVDIHTPEHLYEEMSEFPLIFKNIEYDENEVMGDYMLNVFYPDDSTLSKEQQQKLYENVKPRISRKLIGSYKGEKILIKSDRLKWLVSKGLIITKIYGFIKTKKGKIFEGFVKKVSDERRKGDVDTDYAIIAEMWKLIGNSAFGRSGMNKNRFTKTQFVNQDKFDKLSKKTLCVEGNDLGNGLFEVISKPKSVRQNIPIQVACSIYDDAKFLMCRFYYDFLSKYISKEDFQYIQMDTDSAYMGLTGDFDELIIPEMKEEYEKYKHNWIPRTDTETNINFDRRKAGLFKEEFKGAEMCSLSSKTYKARGFCKIEDSSLPLDEAERKNCKTTCKGIQYNNNREIMDMRFYTSVLKYNTSHFVENRGMRNYVENQVYKNQEGYVENDEYVKNKRIYNYAVKKVGLCGKYTKRRVLDDGVSTVPLDI